MGKRYLARANLPARCPMMLAAFGSLHQLVTSLGDAGFYMERFSGQLTIWPPKPADGFSRRIKLLIWSSAGPAQNLAASAVYKKLRNFLDEDFRH